MLSLLRRLALPGVAVAAFAAIQPAARADTVVSYTTSLTFGTVTSGSVSNGTTSSSWTIDTTGDVLTFNGANVSNFSLDHFNGNTSLPAVPLGSQIDTLSAGGFGSFSLSGAASFTNIGPESFTLTVHQTVPSNGTGSFGSGTITGYIVSNDGNLTLEFTSPTTILVGDPAIGQVWYSVANYDHNQFAITTGGPTTIDGEVADAPLPATASTGLALMGGLGLLTGVNVLRRRRQMA